MINMSNVYYVNSQNLIHGTLMDVEAGICFTSLDSAIFYIGTKCGEISKRFGKKDYDIKVNIYNSDILKIILFIALLQTLFLKVISNKDLNISIDLISMSILYTTIQLKLNK